MTSMKTRNLDHDGRTRLLLQGALGNATCQPYPSLQPAIQGNRVLIYKLKPKNYADCHRGDL